MITSPRNRFLEDKNLSKQWLDISDSKAFERATELSLLQLMEESESIEWLKGAQKLVEIMKTIAEPGKPPAPRPTYALNHDLK
jgi:hypothetical protein